MPLGVLSLLRGSRIMGEHPACNQDPPMETRPAIKVLAGVMIEVHEMGLEGLNGDAAGNKLQ